jgi:yersiniabactin nonribosomal peptide synthetase
MAGKHISIPALLKIGAGALDNLGIYLKELQLQKVVVLFGNGLVEMFGSTVMEALREDFKEETAVIRFSKATTETEEKLLDIWKQLFGYENIGIEDNYFSLGGDSLIATRLISEVQKTFGCKITISTIFENLTVKSLAKAIEQSEQKEEDTLQIKPNLEEAYHPFPLTDVQYAYWLGRSGLYELGNVATHCYFELDADGLDTECAETAWNLLIQRHGMMRVIIQPDGMQRILENTPQYHIDVTDIRQLEVTEKEKALDEKRAEIVDFFFDGRCHKRRF